MKAHNRLKFLFSVIVCEFVGIIGAVFTMRAIPDWYVYLQKPAFSPPNWVFAPVWTLLYFLMGVAAYLVWKHGFIERKDVKIASVLFGIQLIFNIAWSIIFFGMHNPGAALVEIIILWFSILATIIAFYTVSEKTIWFLLPYILWVSFAVYLNYSIYILN